MSQKEKFPLESSVRSPASFRDPSGFIFKKDGVVFRQVNRIYQESYDLLMRSGLYAKLVKENYLIPHDEVSNPDLTSEGYKIIRPHPVPFVSYPYEWSFSELKDAALLTLKIQKLALRFGMTLKDASAYNVQFKDGRPILIDTLSFEKYEPGFPWVAYRQFCTHFLAPLSMMAFKDIRLSQFLRIYLDGIPLDLASTLLPWRSWFKSVTFFHIHLHSKSQIRFSEKKVNFEKRKLTPASLLDLIRNLEDGVQSLKWKAGGTEWADYYENTNYSKSSLNQKAELVSRLILAAKPKSVWDLGANDGFFSRLASEKGIPTLAFDIDPTSVELNYLKVKNEKEKNLLPLIIDLTNPSAASGWNNEERQNLFDRGPVDLGLALALIHHLSITGNVPFESAANFFAKICRFLVIEFVPKDDSQVERLLKNRWDMFPNYNQKSFEKEFGYHFTLTEVQSVPGSKRTLYLMKNKKL